MDAMPTRWHTARTANRHRCPAAMNSGTATLAGSPGEKGHRDAASLFMKPGLG